jgi:putative nucleotidyltransferase with HDIG domain
MEYYSIGKFSKLIGKNAQTLRKWDKKGVSRMNFYRIKQFYWAINSKIDGKDLEFVKLNLNKNELDLFYMLSKQEQKHCIKVAYEVEQVCKIRNLDPDMLKKAALLHDIGKGDVKLTIIDKSIMVLVHNITRGNIKKFSNIRKIDVYYNHGKIGRDMLKNYNYDEKLLYLIENHHNDNVKGYLELDILKMCDSRN